MPRPLRNFIENGVYHATARGVDRLTIFRDDIDREKFLELVQKVVVERGWSCLGYCLMDNHFHLLIRTPVPDLAAGMQYINGQYARWFNKRWGRTGHLFQGRYHHQTIETDEHLLEVARYIPLNPVRAGMVQAAGDWRWSSHNAVIGRARAAWLDVKDLHARFAARFGSDPQSPQKYEQFLAIEEREALRRRAGLAASNTIDDSPPAQGRSVEKRRRDAARKSRRKRHGRRR
jgi:REP element-mobilizing transposase RayT